MSTSRPTTAKATKAAAPAKAPPARRAKTPAAETPATGAARAKTGSKPAKQAKAAAAKPAQAAKADKPAREPKHPKQRVVLVRDSFTMPEADFALVAALKTRALEGRREAKKSELLRAGLHALAALDGAALVAALERLQPVKTGRPKKSH